MKRLVSVMVIGLLILALTACMSNDNPESVIEDFIDGMDDFITDMDKADEAGDVVDAIEEYADRLEDLIPRIKAVQEKFPEFKEIVKGKLPKEYEKFKTRLAEVTKKFMGAFGKLIRYFNDKEVQKAGKKLKEMLSSLD